ncbi:Hypothetical predicted protein [Cloeon dipterum]|uniref:Uncharacterized protein n=1 Tax=Cloeon dipterum TaxID=197152 RepID=A0A8S1D581_9INSE|nr:Hypothetical predicted protein [Cloeon dipterum]
MFDMTKACEEMKQTSRIEHLQLNPNGLSSLADNAEKFPHVTSVSLDWKKCPLLNIARMNLEPLEKFTKLTHLENYDLNCDLDAFTILFKIGANLESLYFGYTQEIKLDIDLGIIKRYCPKLVTLEIIGYGVEDSFSLESFTSLLDLQIKFKFDSSKDLKLSNLLAAPNLKIVKLSGFRKTDSSLGSRSFEWSKTHFTTVMDDETVLNLAKKRLQNLRAKNYSLEKLAVRTILKNVRFYLEIDDQLGQLKSLPGVLREKILQTLIMRKNIDDDGKAEVFKDLMGIFPYLLSSRTRYIELNGILSFVCPNRIASLVKERECCAQLLEWIETLAPKVETLIIKQNYTFPEISYPLDNKPTVLPKMLRSLKKMQHLKTLRVDLFRFKKNDLLEMCKNLPNLHNLNILCHVSGPDPSPEAFTGSFCNVKELTFNNTYWLSDLCNQHLPEIEIVPFNQSEIFDWRRLIYDKYESLKSSILPTEVLTELKDLELRYPFLSYPRNEDDTMILSNILSAPKLEKVVLEGTCLNEADLLKLNSLIENKLILSQLHTFHFYLNCYVNERLKYLTNVLKTACSILPKLSDFRVGRDIYFDHPLLTCAIRKDDQVFDKCIHNLVSLFENEK